MGEEFPARLRELRQKAGLTQTALAEKAGLSRIGVAQLEGGSRAPSWDTVLALAAALGVDCSAFQGPPSKGAAKKPGRGRPSKG